MSYIKKIFLLLFITGIYTSTSALIVWKNEIVPAWPEPPRPFLSKSLSSSASASEGFGYYFQPRGKVYCLTMIVDFSDEAAKFTSEEIDDWLNKPEYSAGKTNGSVRDYYYECSNGILELVNDVVGYYRASKPRSYYESFSDYTGASELVEEMIDHFDSEVDFSKYDNDADGWTEAISIVYAGSGKEWGRGLWPHSGYIGKKRDGVQMGSYNMSDMGQELTLYVFCHETGHMLFGWPDLYWFGDYCIMGNRMNDVNPQAINDFFRADQGWISTTYIEPDDNKAFTATHNGGGYRYVNPSDQDEMYFWSLITTEGRWSNVRGDGILLYYFNAGIKGNTSGISRTLYVVEADGDNEMANAQWPNPGYNISDFFCAENNDSFSEESYPTSQWGLKIYDISEAGESMTFKVGRGVVDVGKPEMRSEKALCGNSNIFSTFDFLGRQCGKELFVGNGRSKASGCYIYRISDEYSTFQPFYISGKDYSKK